MNNNSLFEWYRCLLNAGHGQQLAIIGGGGKSGLLANIAGGLQKTWQKALVTTTTKMQPRELSLALGDDSIYQVSDYRELLAAIDGHGEFPLFCHCGIHGDKVSGVEPHWLEALATDRPHLPVIYEADGSRGLPLKLHAVGEPVLAQSCSVVFLIGLCALGANTRDTLHRFAGSGQCGRIVDAGYLARLATAALDKITVAGNKTLFLNQYELLSAAEIQSLSAVQWNYPVYLGSVRQDYYIQIH